MKQIILMGLFNHLNVAAAIAEGRLLIARTWNSSISNPITFSQLSVGLAGTALSLITDHTRLSSL